MPAAVAIPAIASVVGGGLATVGALKASGAQSRSTQQALDFEKEREATRRSEYDRQQARAEQQWNAYQQQLAPYRNIAMQYLQRYGYRPPQGQTLGSLGGGGQPLSHPPMRMAGSGQTLGAMAGNGQAIPGAGAPYDARQTGRVY